MMQIEILNTILLTHISQFSITMLLLSVVVMLTHRRWPHFTFLICMLALAKCLVPPLISSPAGLFTITPNLALSSDLKLLGNDEGMRIKQLATESAGDSPVANSEFYFEQVASPSVWPSLALGMWLAGIVLFLAWSSSRYRDLMESISKMRSVQPAIAEQVEVLRRQLGIRRQVRAVISEENFGPACVGVWRPTLVLPANIIGQSQAAWFPPLMAHELIHARRGDMVWGILQYFAQIIWWFHPLVWWIGHKATLMCERCCDDEVVSRLEFKAADYAESLVRVLEMKNQCRHVPFGHCISPAQITKQRLERLSSRYSRFSRGPSWGAWSMVALLAIALLPGMQWTRGSNVVGNTNDIEFRAKVRYAVDRQEWQTVIDLLRPIYEECPDNVEATFWLGLALHMDGKLDEAIEFHSKAAQFPETACVATYNWACALALKGESEAALDRLEAAIAAGFAQRAYFRDFIDDADLKSLYKLERFKKLRNQALQINEQFGPRGELDFLVGSWEVTDSNFKMFGQSNVVGSVSGHVLTEHWKLAPGQSGSSVKYFNPFTGRWKQAWVSDSGGVIELEGAPKDGKIEFEGVMYDQQGATKKSRMKVTPESDGSVRQLIEVSSDEGNTWDVFLDRTYRRFTPHKLQLRKVEH
ncbi:MAG: hypothetical protein KDB03_19480 [Planctomycetales bacterium]|nr:hypothetical protein [Planctomycetales bacterium]